MEIINAIECACIARISEVRDICLREEICDISGGINNGSPNNANCIRNIGASYIRLEKRSVNLTSVEDFASFGVERTDPVLGRG